jgi:diguanylate cyclase (GGDEF)-like protein
MDDCIKKLEIEISRRENLELAYKEKSRSYETLKKHLDSTTVTDQITGALNRIKIDSILENELQRCSRYGNNLCIVLIRVKDFARIQNIVDHNSINFGLRRLASLISECLRNTDYFGRWGDDSFIVVLTETTLGHVEIFINRLNSILSSTDFKDIGQIICKYGAVQFAPGDDYMSITKRAKSELDK